MNQNVNQDISLHFRDVELNDKKALGDFMQRFPVRRLNYCFEVLYLWREACEFQIEFYNNFLLIKTFIDCHHNFLYPLGEGDVGSVIEKMIHYAEARRCPFRLFQLSVADRDRLEDCCPGRFSFELERGESEYIYSSEKLATLSGKKLQQKRNHINYFEQNNEWRFEPLTAANLSDCYDFNKRWFDARRASGDFGEMLELELSAIEKAFSEWALLGLDGALLRANGEVVAYSIGSPLTSDTYLVLFEKSLHDVRGASQQINRLFVQRYAKNYAFVNRAEDGGDEGLRQAKLSYHPDVLDEVYSARLKVEHSVNKPHYDTHGNTL